MNREQVTGVQYLRGIAALSVVFSHSVSLTEGKVHSVTVAGRTLAYGHLGVDLFFLISGFIIATVSLSGRESAPAVGVGAFFLRRFTRIVPLMWISIATYAIIGFLGGHRDVRSYLRAAFLLPGVLEPYIVWTLRQEFIFYVIFATTFLTGGRWRWLILLWFLAIALVPRGPSTPWSHDTPLALLLNLRNLGFAGGLGLAIWFARAPHVRLRSSVEPLLILGVASALAMFVIIPLFGIDTGIGTTVVLLPLLFMGVYLECPPGLARRIGELFGNASYSIYLFHYPVITVLLVGWVKLCPAVNIWVVSAVCMICSTAVGLASHLALERPLIAQARRLFKLDDGHTKPC